MGEDEASFLPQEEGEALMRVFAVLPLRRCVSGKLSSHFGHS